jgi:hypothetical protein
MLILKEVVLIYFRSPEHYSPRGTEKTTGILVWTISWSRFEKGISRLEITNVKFSFIFQHPVALRDHSYYSSTPSIMQ